jgi:hypothetical protein
MKIKLKHKAWKRFLLTKEGEDYSRYKTARREARMAMRKAVMACHMRGRLHLSPKSLQKVLELREVKK